MVTLLALELQGEKIAVDPLTYGNFKTQASSLGIELVPCEGDEHGMIPNVLLQTARNRGLRAVYLMPTVHNPLGLVMPEERRREICEVAARCDLMILDDDAYCFLEAHPPPSFAVLAPERAFSTWSFTKPFAPAMKLAFLSFPEQYSWKLTSMIKVTSSGASVLFAEMATRLIRNGALAELLEAKRSEAAERQKLAGKIFAGLDVQAHPASYHLWVHLPAHKPANGIAERLAADGILVNSSEAYCATADVEANGMRIAMGGVRELAALQKALEQVRYRIESHG
jgi:DNA-binding transcriptional MocR family regulator